LEGGNERLLDISNREFATFAPLLVLAVWMGLYPSPFLRRIESSVQHIIVRVSPQYAAKYAECNPTPTPEAVAASSNPAAKFLAGLPCDANGNPIIGDGSPKAAGGDPSPSPKPAGGPPEPR